VGVIEMRFLGCVFIFGLLSTAHASLLPEEPVPVRSRAHLDDFFKFPQFSIQLGHKSSTGTAKFQREERFMGDDGLSINTLGFATEVNWLSFMNIGGLFFVDLKKIYDNPAYSDASKAMPSAFYLGFFTRFFYAPSFLKSKQQAIRFFTTWELKAGSRLVDVLPLWGVAPAIYVGVELDISRWIGFSVSWGKSYEYAWRVRGADESDVKSLSGPLNSYQGRSNILLFAFRTGF